MLSLEYEQNQLDFLANKLEVKLRTVMDKGKYIYIYKFEI